MLSHISAQYLFITSESELGYYHQKVNVRVVSRVAVRLKTLDLKNLEKFEKISEILELLGSL